MLLNWINKFECGIPLHWPQSNRIGNGAGLPCLGTRYKYKFNNEKMYRPAIIWTRILRLTSTPQLLNRPETTLGTNPAQHYRPAISLPNRHYTTNPARCLKEMLESERCDRVVRFSVKDWRWYSSENKTIGNKLKIRRKICIVSTF